VARDGTAGDAGGPVTLPAPAARPGGGCLFCSIVAGTTHAELVYEDDVAIAFMDIHPMTDGHTLVVPRRHSQDLFDIPPDDLAGTLETARAVAKILVATFEPLGINLIQNNGAAAHQTQFHFHVHVVPRYGHDWLRAPFERFPGDLDRIRAVAARIRATPDDR
jgi:histidine triad (HIT) family protein